MAQGFLTGVKAIRMNLSGILNVLQKIGPGKNLELWKKCKMSHQNENTPPKLGQCTKFEVLSSV
jgi:hypothetical protein